MTQQANKPAETLWRRPERITNWLGGRAAPASPPSALCSPFLLSLPLSLTGVDLPHRSPYEQIQALCLSPLLSPLVSTVYKNRTSLPFSLCFSALAIRESCNITIKNTYTVLTHTCIIEKNKTKHARSVLSVTGINMGWLVGLSLPPDSTCSLCQPALQLNDWFWRITTVNEEIYLKKSFEKAELRLCYDRSPSHLFNHNTTTHSRGILGFSDHTWNFFSSVHSGNMSHREEDIHHQSGVSCTLRIPSTLLHPVCI